jgi:hypothetical protein
MNFVTAKINLVVCLHAGRAIRVMGASLALLLFSLPLFSQTNQGTIQGGVFDQTGGAIAGATVTVIDVARGVSRPLATDSAGAYVAPNLIPGMYTVRGEAKGFQTLERSNILLEVGQTTRVDLVLQPGAQTQTITVSAESVTINTSDATLGGTVSNDTLVSLPMNGRDFKNFMSLRPGVTTMQGGGLDTWAANGTRAEDVGYLVDGLRVDESYTGQSLMNSNTPSGGSSTGLPLDAIQEINNQQNPKAEVGWKPGSIVNIGIKSGTNTLHGTGFAFGRDTAFDARNFFDPAPNPQQPVDFEEFGGNLGGRILKDKLFWFGAYEGQRYTVGNIGSTTEPATVSLGGCTIGSAVTCGDVTHSIVDACLSIINGGLTISPLSAHLVGLDALTSSNGGASFTGGSCAVSPQNFTPGASFSPYPTIAGNIGTNAINLNTTAINQEDNGIGKIDYHINDRNTVYGEYFYALGNGIFPTPTTLSIPNGGPNSSPFAQLLGPIQPQLVSGAWNFTPTSTRINEFRVGFNRYHQAYTSVDAGQSGTAVNPLLYGFNTGQTDSKVFGMPSISIGGGISGFGGGQSKLVGPDGSLQLLDHFSLVHGNHSFKFGGEFLWNYVTVYSNSAGKGTFSFANQSGFTNLQNFLQGMLKTSGNCCTIQEGDFTRHLRNQDYSLFLQDDWRMSRKVILNFGLRWEYNSVLTETHNLLATFDPNVGLEQVGTGIPPLKSPYPGSFKNFSPRLGFAWDINGNGKTVVRAGGSLMYSYLPVIDFNAVAQVMGITQNSTGATIIDAACPAPVGCPGGGTMKVGSQSLKALGPTGVDLGWNAQTTACVSGGTTTCGSVIPSSAFKFQCGDSLAPNAAPGDPAGCIAFTVDPKLSTPWIGTWNVGIQRAITNSLSLDASYVGTHGGALAGIVDLNQAALGSGFTAAQLACVYSAAGSPVPGSNPGSDCGDPSQASLVNEFATRPFASKFPYLTYINELTNLDRSNYNALQVTLTQRASHGLSFLAGYTFSKAMDQASTNSFVAIPLNSANPGALYGPSDFDIRNRFTLTTTYNIPGIKAPGQMLEGWQINSIVNLSGALPWTAKDTADDFSGNGESSNKDVNGGTWVFVGNPSDFNGPNLPAGVPCWSGTGSPKLSNGGLSPLQGCPAGAIVSPTVKVATAPPAACTAAATALGPSAVGALNLYGCYVKGNSVLVPPALGTYQDGQRNIFRDSGFRNWDLSITKTWKYRERYNAQFRAEFFNILNHTNFANPGGIGGGAGFNSATGGNQPSTALGCGCVTPDQAAPNPVLGSGSARAMELGLKLNF